MTDRPDPPTAAAPPDAASPAAGRAPKPPGRGARLRRLLPLLVLVALAGAAYLLLGDRLSVAALRDNRAALRAFVADNALLAGLAYLVAYAAVVAVSLPGSAVFTIAGGFLFGLAAGTALAVVGATAGAALVFLTARTGLGEPLRARAGPAVRRMEKGFRDNALGYLLFLRLVPVFPFWLVNLVSAVLGVGLGTYLLGTFLGIIPGALVYASVGNGLDAAFAAGRAPDLGIIFRPEILLPILGLAVLALLPGIVRKLRARS